MSNVVKTNIDEAIARIDDWKGKEIHYESVAGGVTNPNFKVFVDGTPHFLKIPGDGTDFIDRENCHMANMIASDSGVGAKVEYYFEDTGVEVFEWLEGYHSTVMGEMFVEDITKASIRAIKKFHNLPGANLPCKASIFDQCRDMVERAKASDYLPPWHRRMLWLMDSIEYAFNTYGVESKPCHNDYWFNNFMWNEEKKDGKIIDLEYASMNDPMFDVGSWSLGFATEAMDKEIITEYNDGVYDEVLFARMKLNQIACDIKWSYWALMQTAISGIEFDYYGWYIGKLDRLRHRFLDPRIDTWLDLLEGKPVWRTSDAWKYE